VILGTLVDLGVALLILGLMALATLTRSLMTSVVALLIAGVLLALAWMRLGAPDVALTEGAVGGGLTGLLLLSAVNAARGGAAQGTTHAAPHAAPHAASARRGKPPSRPSQALVAILCAGVTASLAALVLSLPEPAPSLVDATLPLMPLTGLENPVNGVLLAFRAMDTLQEKVVLVLALLATWITAPDAAWGGAARVPGALYPDPLRFLARLLPPVGIMMAFFILWTGATAPGGAFAAGTILAVMWLLVAMAGLVRPPKTASRRLRGMIVIGPLLFLAIGFAGVFLSDAFLAYPVPLAKAIIVGLELPLMLSVAAVLALLLAGRPVEAAAKEGRLS
jgi:multisubunit Na+/H+ antiporter MnhB subunit